jgi:hypothetical protein
MITEGKTVPWFSQENHFLQRWGGSGILEIAEHYRITLPGFFSVLGSSRRPGKEIMAFLLRWRGLQRSRKD